MKKIKKDNKQVKLPSFVQLFAIALTIYCASFIFSKTIIYSKLLKVLCVIILLEKEIIEVLKQIGKKEQHTKENIITTVILILVLFNKFDSASISSILFFLKKYILKNDDKSEIEEEIKKSKEAQKGDVVLLKKGMILYFDGILKMPKAYFLNQDGKRIAVKSKQKVLSGWVNLTDNAKVEVETNYTNTEYYLLEQKMEKVINAKSKKELEIIKVFSIYQTIILIAMGIYILMTLLLQLEIEKTLYTSTLFITLTYLVNPTNVLINTRNNTIKKLFKERIIVENKDILSKVVKIKNYIFEKTKTLTVGDFRITEIETEDEEQLFYYLNYGEYFSNHPIKDAILKYKAYDVEIDKIKAYKSYPNRGIYYKIDNHEVLIGNLRFMKENDIDVDINFGIGTIIYVAVDKEGIGNILISDGIKYKTKLAIQHLKKTKPKHLAIISADNDKITTAIAKELKIKDHYSNLTEKEKKFWIRHLKEKYPYKTALIGSTDTKEDLQKEVDVSIILTNSIEKFNKKSDIQLLDNDLFKLNLLNDIIKAGLKREKIDKILTIFILFLLDVLLICNALPLWLIIIISFVLEILENKIRKEG